MSTLDDVNRRYGRGSLRPASASPFALSPCRTWHLRSDHRSPRWTTRWEELPMALATRAPGGGEDDHMDHLDPPPALGRPLAPGRDE